MPCSGFQVKSIVVNERIELQITASDHKKRLDDYLFDRFSGLSKMYLRDIVKSEKCEVNGRFENIGYKVRANDFVEIDLDLTRETAMRPQEMPLDIVFEDAHLIVVNKPAGMLVHPTHRDKSGTLLNALTFYLNAERGMRNAELTQNCLAAEIESAGQLLRVVMENKSAIRFRHSAFIRPGLVHRLDKQTSGLIVVAKTSQSHRVLADHFKRKLVEKRYLALVDSVVGPEEGVIDAPIGRYAEHKHWDVKEDGKPAETKFCVRERFSNTTLLELEPVTGRTNQLRIHCASIGHPIVGDIARGGRAFSRLCLHAHKLKLWHPLGSERLEFEAALPVVMTAHE
jgi:23S rRNA pseudouridine1911/1915/1917 synthase